MRVAEKWDGKMQGIGQGGGDWKQRARRGEAEAAAARAGAVTAQLKAEAHARQLEREIAIMRESIGWRLTGAAPARQRAAPEAAPRPLASRSRYSSSARRTSSFEIAGLPPWRTREMRSATANDLDLSSSRSTPSCCAARAPVHGGLDHLHVRRGEVVDPVRLEPSKDRVAIVGLDQLGHRAGPRCSLVPDHPQAEERRHDREPHARALRDEVLDGGQHPVAGAALLLGRPGERKAAWVEARLAREQSGALDHRLAVRLGDGLGRVVAVAARVRPADVVQQDQRQLVAIGLLRDQAQLFANGVVVVVAVENHGVGARKCLERVVARLADQLELRALRRQLHEFLLRSGVDGRHPRPRARGPVEQQPRDVAGVRAYLDDRARLRRVQACDHQLGVVGERGAPAPRVVLVGVQFDAR